MPIWQQLYGPGVWTIHCLCETFKNQLRGHSTLGEHSAKRGAPGGWESPSAYLPRSVPSQQSAASSGGCLSLWREEEDGTRVQRSGFLACCPGGQFLPRLTLITSRKSSSNPGCVGAPEKEGEPRLDSPALWDRSITDRPRGALVSRNGAFPQPGNDYTEEESREDVTPGKVWEIYKLSNWADWTRFSTVWEQSVKPEKSVYFLQMPKSQQKIKRHTKKHGNMVKS